MVLGALACPADMVRQTALAIRELKRKHNLPDSFEVKWNKVSPGGADFYLDVIDLFFESDGLSFRGLVVPNKAVLRHDEFGQTHDHWYYKMYYLLLRPVLKVELGNRVFLDIKDTCGGPKVRKLESFLRSHLHDDKNERLLGIQLTDSKQSSLIQIADLLIGALAYVHRDLNGNAGKMAIIKRVQHHTGLTLKWSTAPGRRKFDVFVWEANLGDA